MQNGARPELFSIDIGQIESHDVNEKVKLFSSNAFSISYVNGRRWMISPDDGFFTRRAQTLAGVPFLPITTERSIAEAAIGSMCRPPYVPDIFEREDYKRWGAAKYSFGFKYGNYDMDSVTFMTITIDRWSGATYGVNGNFDFNRQLVADDRFMTPRISPSAAFAIAVASSQASRPLTNCQLADARFRVAVPRFEHWWHAMSSTHTSVANSNKLMLFYKAVFNGEIEDRVVQQHVYVDATSGQAIAIIEHPNENLQLPKPSGPVDPAVDHLQVMTTKGLTELKLKPSTRSTPENAKRVAIFDANRSLILARWHKPTSVLSVGKSSFLAVDKDSRARLDQAILSPVKKLNRSSNR